jgi:uncharacterized membrane protein
MNNHQKIRKITITAILAALLTILAFLPIRVSALEITLTVIPIAVGIILCGTSTGIILGSFFGVISFLQCLGYSPFGAVLLSINPWLTLLVCLPTRILVGVIPSLIHKMLVKKNKNLAQILVCVLVPVLNTLFFMTMLCVCFYNTDYIQNFVNVLGAANPFTFVILFVGINGLVEIICGVFVSYPISKALEIVTNK